MATVAELSDGRAILGLGAGGGVALDPAGIARTEPLKRTQDALRVARAVIRGQATEGYWAVPGSELARTVDLVHQGSARRRPDLPDVGITWAPLVERGDASRAMLRRASAYAVLNNRDQTRER